MRTIQEKFLAELESSAKKILPNCDVTVAYSAPNRGHLHVMPAAHSMTTLLRISFAFDTHSLHMDWYGPAVLAAKEFLQRMEWISCKQQAGPVYSAHIEFMDASKMRGALLVTERILDHSRGEESDENKMA